MEGYKISEQDRIIIDLIKKATPTEYADKPTMLKRIGSGEYLVVPVDIDHTAYGLDVKWEGKSFL